MLFVFSSVGGQSDNQLEYLRMCVHHAHRCVGSLHCADGRDASVTDWLLLLLLRCQSAFLVLLERKSGLDIRPSRVAKFKVRKAISAAIRDLTVADVSHFIKQSSKACATRRSADRSGLPPGVGSTA